MCKPYWPWVLNGKTTRNVACSKQRMCNFPSGFNNLGTGSANVDNEVGCLGADVSGGGRQVMRTNGLYWSSLIYSKFKGNLLAARSTSILLICFLASFSFLLLCCSNSSELCLMIGVEVLLELCM